MVGENESSSFSPFTVQTITNEDKWHNHKTLIELCPKQEDNINPIFYK